MQANQLIVFVKAPRPGLVKTRLAKSMGQAGACVAYREMVESLLKSLNSMRHVELRYAPDEAATEIEPWLQSTWARLPQGDGNLGQRLQRAFAEAFSRGIQRCVVIGSDCPEVTPDDVQQAWNELRNHDLVIGPATDGGYWLVGLQTPQPQLFEKINWSTDQVLAETLHRARQLDLRIQLLRILSDVDTAKQWKEWKVRLNSD